MLGQDACVFPVAQPGRGVHRAEPPQQQQQQQYLMLFDQPGLFDQHGCTPFLARLDGSLASTISPPLKTDDGDTASPPLLISMYSDAQCPCSAQFVSDVRHIMRHRAFNGSVDLEQIFVPTCMDVFDHCSDDPEVQAQQFLQCIHGDEECLGHRYFLCA